MHKYMGQKIIKTRRRDMIEFGFRYCTPRGGDAKNCNHFRSLGDARDAILCIRHANRFIVFD